jgi:hypothetical protein
MQYGSERRDLPAQWVFNFTLSMHLSTHMLIGYVQVKEQEESSWEGSLRRC